MSGAAEGAQPATYKQPSRKGKKAWRKNVDVTDVQSGLDAVRGEEIQGGVMSEKPAEELFITDLTGDAEVARKQEGKKLLKADEILALRSAIPGLDGRKRKADESKLIAASGSSKKQKNGKYVSHKELQRLKRIAHFTDGTGELEESKISYDPWAPVVVEKDPRLDFLDEVKPTREPKTLKEAPKSLAVNGRAIPAVPKPAAGKSYNPLVTDWSELLEREGAAAVEAEKKRLEAIALQEEREAAALAEAAKVEAAEKDEYATDYDSAWESEWDGIQSGDEGAQIYTQKQHKRKTPAERNKAKARKEREAREKWEAKEKKKGEHEKRIKEIAKENSARDKAKRHSRALVAQDGSDSESEEEGEQTKLQRRRFGQHQLPDQPLEVVLPDELEDTLRRLKPEGNLLADRYRNLLVNGKVEVRKRQWQKKQAKKEVTEKWTYKDWKLPK